MVELQGSCQGTDDASRFRESKRQMENCSTNLYAMKEEKDPRSSKHARTE